MPHFFANRPRLHDVVAKDPSLSDHFRWETINAITYQVGGVFFIIGSICFFPELPGDADIGARIFIIGSVLFLLVTSHDMAEVVRHYRTCAGRHMAWVHLEFWAAAAYIAGTLLFVVGSLLPPAGDRSSHPGGLVPRGRQPVFRRRGHHQRA